LWVGFEGVTLTEGERRRFREGRAGGAILFARNIAEAADGFEVEAVWALTHELHRLGAACDEATLVSVDQEGGRVQRLKAPATRWPAMGTLDNFSLDKAIELATFVGTSLGRELFALGFDIDFAPVLDVHTNPDNPIIGDRALSKDAERVADTAIALATALTREGILPCGKHFPGHGDTDTDSHLSLPTLPHSMERLQEIELLPFQKAAKAQLPMIMTAHIVFSAIDGARPATLSPDVITGLLRKKLKFDGIIVSDDLDMKAIASHYGAAEAAVAAIDAGCDALLLCKDQDSQDAAYEALVRESEARPSFRTAVKAAAGRLRAQKKRLFRGRPAQPSAEAARDILGQAATAALYGVLTN